MATETKIVKGGFRATLALLISIVAIVVAIIAYNRTGGEADLKAQIKDLQTKMERIKRESSEQMGKLRDETAKTLEKIGKVIKKEKEESKP